MLSYKLTGIWNRLYPGCSAGDLEEFIRELEPLQKRLPAEPLKEGWYKDAVVYSLYVDLFNNDFPGLNGKLDYLQDLGINCIWLLPVLDSPMKDAGFDIRNYRLIRKDLTGLDNSASDEEHLAVFSSFLAEAHARGIRVIFDIAVNHTSVEHYWFQESRKSPDNPYRDYYIWNKDDKRYSDCRLLFKGMCPGNWEKDGDRYFFHRFFEHQPDLNYRNPAVLLEMCRNMIFWLQLGVDGFRADAIPYLWKEEGTDCENLPETHIVVKFFRAVLDFVRPNTLLLAEACQPPFEVVKYLSSEDECNAGYHFPLMPQIFKAIGKRSRLPVKHTLSNEVTPSIPSSSQWFTFLRCHDELSLELVYVSEEDRKYIHSTYCYDPKWDFREGEGISARLSELMERNPDMITLAFSIMLTLPGTPVIYYGDEFGKLNDKQYYHKKIKETGHDDTRFLVRGHVDWKQLEKDLNNPESLSFRVFERLKMMIKTRNMHRCFGRGELEWLDTEDGIMAFTRSYYNEKLLIIHNMTKEQKDISLYIQGTDFYDLLSDAKFHGKNTACPVPAFGFYWLEEI